MLGVCYFDGAWQSYLMYKWKRTWFASTWKVVALMVVFDIWSLVYLEILVKCLAEIVREHGLYLNLKSKASTGT